MGFEVIAESKGRNIGKTPAALRVELPPWWRRHVAVGVLVGRSNFFYGENLGDFIH